MLPAGRVRSTGPGQDGHRRILSSSGEDGAREAGRVRHEHGVPAACGEEAAAPRAAGTGQERVGAPSRHPSALNAGCQASECRPAGAGTRVPASVLWPGGKALRCCARTFLRPGFPGRFRARLAPQ